MNPKTPSQPSLREMFQAAASKHGTAELAPLRLRLNLLLSRRAKPPERENWSATGALHLAVCFRDEACAFAALKAALPALAQLCLSETLAENSLAFAGYEKKSKLTESGATLRLRLPDGTLAQLDRDHQEGQPMERLREALCQALESVSGGLASRIADSDNAALAFCEKIALRESSNEAAAGPCQRSSPRSI